MKNEIKYGLEWDVKIETKYSIEIRRVDASSEKKARAKAMVGLTGRVLSIDIVMS